MTTTTSAQKKANMAKLQPVKHERMTPMDMAGIKHGPGVPCEPSEATKFKLAKVGTRVCAEPFYASLWIALRPQFSTTLPTACVTSTGRIMVNPHFLDACNTKQAVGVALHEILHEVLMHIPRTIRMFGLNMTPHQMKVANYAADAIINDLLLRKYAASGSAAAIDVELPDSAVLLENGFVNDKTFEEVVRWVMDNAEPSGDGEGGEGGEGLPGFAEFESDWEIEKPGSGDGKDGENGDGKDGKSPGESSGAGRDQQAADAMRRQMVAAAVDHAKKMGRMPAGLDRHIEGVLVPKKSYTDMIRQALQPIFASGRDDYSWRRPHRGYAQVGIYAPAVRAKLGLRTMAFWVDTSGSQSQQMVEDCVAEVLRVCEDTGVEQAHICYCDTKIHRIDIIEMGQSDYQPGTAPGGGGTNVRPVYEYAEEIGAEAIVCLTDMCVDFPEDPGVPVLWITTDARYRHPGYGEVVELYE